MTVSNVVVGAVTPTSVAVRAKITGGTARLAVATDPALSGPVFSPSAGPGTPDGMVPLSVAGLEPDTLYWWAVEEDGVLDARVGRFRTHPPVGQAASFEFVVSSCADGSNVPGVGDVLLPDRVSNHPVFDTVRLRALADGALFFAHLGDMHYYNIGQNPATTPASVDFYRRAYDDVFLQPLQAALYGDVPLVYIWDDHDYGPNNSDDTAPGRLMVAQVYRERFPSYTLPDATGACYHSFQVGRVLFVCTDSRFFRTPDTAPDDASKTMLGTSQKTWLSSVLSSTDAKALVLLHQMQWTGGPVVDGDSWRGFTTERAELGQMFVDLGWADRMIIIGGDSHRNSMDSGGSNPDGEFPTYCFGALGSGTAGPLSNNPPDGVFDIGFQPGPDQYGVVQVSDDGAKITLTSTAYLGDGAVMTHTVRIVAGTAPVPSATTRIQPHYSWYAGTLVDGRITTQIPVLSSSWSQVMDDAGALQVVLPLADPDVAALQPYVTAEPARCFLAVAYTDSTGTETFLEAGPVWVHDYDGGSKQLTIGGAGLWSYWDHRKVLPVLAAGQTPKDVSTTFTAALSAIARRLVQLAQSHTGGHVPVVLPAEETGSNTRTWPGYEMHDVGDELRALTKVDGGPEIAFVPRRHPDDGRFLQWVMNTGTTAAPMLTQLGQDWIWDQSVPKSSVSGLTVQRDGSAMAGRVWVQGAGTDKETLFAQANDASLITAGFPLLELLDSEHSGEKGASVAGTLAAYAAGDLALSRRPQETWTLTVRRDETPAVSSYRPGHWVQATVRRDPYLPDATIRSRIVQVAGDDTLDVRIQLSPLVGGI